jgi:hypothetical protein
VEQGGFGGQYETGMSGKHCWIFGRPMSAQVICVDPRCFVHFWFAGVARDRTHLRTINRSKNWGYIFSTHVCARARRGPVQVPPGIELRPTA